MGAQAAASPALSHMGHQTSGAYPSSPGHSVGYGMPSGQQQVCFKLPTESVRFW